MNLMIASDIHGSAYYCKELLERFEAEDCDRLLLLGDLLYHGPRNELPRDYNPKSVIGQLNAYKTRIFCVRGNCDAAVDQMVLEFPIMADYAVIDSGDRLIYATHGHIYNEITPPPLRHGDILICGHTHIPACIEHDDFLYLNPGSVSIPKNNSVNGYMTLKNGVFLWKDLLGNTVSEYSE